MSSHVVDLRSADDRRDVIHRAAQRLAAGELVAFPTETVYVLAALSLQPAAVVRVHELSRDLHNGSPQFGLKTAEEANDYVPGLTSLGQKLARRCWPGPVTLAFDESATGGLLAALPEETRAHVAHNGGVRFRVPAHDVLTTVLRYLPAPVVLSTEGALEAAGPASAAEADRLWGRAAGLIIDDGPCRYGEPSTVVRVHDDQWRVEAPGVVTQTTLGRLASEVYLFVCTGNTCRSPMAEGLFRKLLSEKLQCGEDELCDRGFTIASAGLSAASGAPAAMEAIELFSRRSIDLNAHESQPLTDRLLAQADHIFTMTRSHRDSIVSVRPEAAGRIELLSREGSDISDPIGGGLSDYETCAAEIEQHVRSIVDQIPV